jgi:hypothetical protein
MKNIINRRKSGFFYRFLSLLISFSFGLSAVTPPDGHAQTYATLLNLPPPGAMVNLTSGFTPVIVRGITFFPEEPFRFNFIVDSGDTGLRGIDLEGEADKLIKYFLASLTVPQDDMWVNLSPYESDRIIPENFGDTVMGRDLLAQDYILKQLSSSLMHPEEELGKTFWDRAYSKAYENLGTREIQLNTFNKIWIVPDKATVLEHENSVYVIESHLKVMLEEDYVALNKNSSVEKYGLDSLTGENARITSGSTSDAARQVLIPEIEKEVNEGETFANLRQIYNSMILATWYKDKLKESLLGQIYVDQNKTRGVDNEDKEINRKIYDQYVASFKKGVYNLIKEEYDPVNRQIIPKKYFSGGFGFNEIEIKSSTPNNLPPEHIKKISFLLGIPFAALLAGASYIPNSEAKNNISVVETRLSPKKDSEELTIDIHDKKEMFSQRKAINKALKKKTAAELFGILERAEKLQEMELLSASPNKKVLKTLHIAITFIETVLQEKEEEEYFKSDRRSPPERPAFIDVNKLIKRPAATTNDMAEKLIDITNALTSGKFRDPANKTRLEYYLDILEKKLLAEWTWRKNLSSVASQNSKTLEEILRVLKIRGLSRPARERLAEYLSTVFVSSPERSDRIKAALALYIINPASIGRESRLNKLITDSLQNGDPREILDIIDGLKKLDFDLSPALQPQVIKYLEKIDSLKLKAGLSSDTYNLFDLSRETILEFLAGLASNGIKESWLSPQNEGITEGTLYSLINLHQAPESSQTLKEIILLVVSIAAAAGSTAAGIKYLRETLAGKSYSDPKDEPFKNGAAADLTETRPRPDFQKDRYLEEIMKNINGGNIELAVKTLNGAEFETNKEAAEQNKEAVEKLVRLYTSGNYANLGDEIVSGIKRIDPDLAKEILTVNRGYNPAGKLEKRTSMLDGYGGVNEDKANELYKKLDSSVGGISLNRDLLDIKIQRDPAGRALPLNMQPRDIQQIDGLYHHIINITPVTAPLIPLSALSYPNLTRTYPKPFIRLEK